MTVLNCRLVQKKTIIYSAGNSNFINTVNKTDNTETRKTTKISKLLKIWRWRCLYQKADTSLCKINTWTRLYVPVTLQIIQINYWKRFFDSVLWKPECYLNFLLPFPPIVCFYFKVTLSPYNEMNLEIWIEFWCPSASLIFRWIN